MGWKEDIVQTVYDIGKRLRRNEKQIKNHETRILKLENR
jgi:DNA-binding CsgD family transcriptional regulator